HQLHLEQLVALLDEQRRRAVERVDLTPEPMTTTLERAEFDARVASKNQQSIESAVRDSERAQDGPEWVEWSGGECPVPQGNDVEVKFLDGQIHRDRQPEGWAWNAREVSCIIEKYRDWTAWEQSK
ncbi:MAG TPA: hypothetical protein V6D20_03450, partial [Candidatus Obscuribacterales bacterium]